MVQLPGMNPVEVEMRAEERGIEQERRVREELDRNDTRRTTRPVPAVIRLLQRLLRR